VTKSLAAQKAEAEAEAQRAIAQNNAAQARWYAMLIKEKRRDFEAEDAEVLNQRIYDFNTDVRQASVTECIETLSEWRHRSPDPMTIRFTSPGGQVMPGLALFDYILALRDEGIVVNTVALGEAASMAGILLQAGTKRFVGPNTYLLIHEVTSSAIGKTSEVEDEIAFVKRIQARLVGILAERSTMKPAAITRRWRRKDWWLDADEVVRLGFADVIYRGRKAPRRKAR